MYEAIKFGHDNKIKTALLVPLEGSEGFYSKMGFTPEVEGHLDRAALDSPGVLAENGWHANISSVFSEFKKQSLTAWKIT